MMLVYNFRFVNKKDRCIIKQNYQKYVIFQVLYLAQKYFVLFEISIVTIKFNLI